LALHTVILGHKEQAVPTMSLAELYMSVTEFYHILMSNKLQWKYKEVQVVMVNLRYHPGSYLERLRKTIKPSDRQAYIKAQFIP
jgi:hypothetical protein